MEQQDDEAPPKRRWMVTALLVAPVFVFLALWGIIHAVPTAGELRRLLIEGTAVEIYQMADGSIDRMATIADANVQRSLSESLTFKQNFWSFSREPVNTTVVRIVLPDRRELIWDVRDDGHLHLRKGRRWYRMPVEPAFRELTVELLKERGRPVPKEQFADPVMERLKSRLSSGPEN